MSARPELAPVPEVPAATPAIPWPGVLHDLRGAATAIDALAGLVADDAPALSPASHGLLGLIQARAEQLGTLCEAVSWLQDPRSGQAPLERTLRSSTGRLQKFLRRSGLALKSLGEIPDRSFESRPLGVLLQSVLVAAVNARESSGPGTAALEVVVNGTTRIAIRLSGPGWGTPALEAVRALSCPEGSIPLGASGVAACAALRHLGATLTASLGEEALTAFVDLPEPRS
jgi:hypothetical protein